MVALGVNKQRLKANLMKNGTTIPLTLLHNTQTKQLNSAKNSVDQNKLQQLLEELQKIPNAKLRVFKNEFIGNIYLI